MFDAVSAESPSTGVEVTLRCNLLPAEIFASGSKGEVNVGAVIVMVMALEFPGTSNLW